MSRQELADEINARIYGSDRDQRFGGIDAKYIGKLERGIYRWPNARYRTAFRQVLGVATDAELGFFITRRSRDSLAVAFPSSSVIRPDDSPDNHTNGTDWPAWFGMRLANTMSMLNTWRGGSSGAVQALLHQEMLMTDASIPSTGRTTFEASRRQMLIALATMPLVSDGPAPDADHRTAGQFLAQCEAGLAAGWRLLKGTDLDTVGRLVSGYLTRIEILARRPSRYQLDAARLASQGHRVAGIVALHRNHIRAREQHCQRALEYAALSKDVGSQVSALISLASTHFYLGEPLRATRTYERALEFDSAMPQLQRSRTRAELAVVYGQLGRDREAREAANGAEELFPEQPAEDPSYLYAEFASESLALEIGLAYLALAQNQPSRGYQQMAADVLARASDSTEPASDRITYEIANHQARAATLIGDLDAFEAHLTRGARGAAVLGSRQRRIEAVTAWRLATETWPADRRLQRLGRSILPALAVGSEG